MVSLARQKALTGYLFTLPFIIGFILFFFAPFIQAVVFSLNKLKFVPGGYELEFIEWENYRYALFTDTEFVRVFVETIVQMLLDVPSIIFFSFFAAMLLNQNFRGRLIARTIFFLPVILSAGVILAMEQTDYMTQLLETSSSSAASFLSGPVLTRFLMQLRLPREVLIYVVNVVDHIPDVIRSSGIQILIFLAGLQSIPPSLYEASKVEGASGWQSFWLITFPMMSPIILANVVYSIIDSFLAADNTLVQYIRETAFRGAGFGIGTAMGVMYFGAIAVILAVTVGIMSRWVFYHE